MLWRRTLGLRHLFSEKGKCGWRTQPLTEELSQCDSEWLFVFLYTIRRDGKQIIKDIATWYRLKCTEEFDEKEEKYVFSREMTLEVGRERIAKYTHRRVLLLYHLRDLQAVVLRINCATDVITARHDRESIRRRLISSIHLQAHAIVNLIVGECDVVLVDSIPKERSRVIHRVKYTMHRWFVSWLTISSAESCSDPSPFEQQ